MSMTEDVMEKERVGGSIRLLTSSKAEVKPGILHSSWRCESSGFGLTISSVAGIDELEFHKLGQVDSQQYTQLDEESRHLSSPSLDLTIRIHYNHCPSSPIPQAQ